MAFPPGFLDELRNRISLSGLVGRRVKLTRRGREHAGLCPFHHEKTPSFYVVDDKNFFHCFGCGAHGDAIGFVMRADNLDFLEAVEKLAGEAGLAVPQATPEEREKAQRQKTLLETLEAAAAFYETRLWAPAGGRARDYLEARGLDPDTIRRFRLGWASEDRQALRRALARDFPEPLLLEAGLIHDPADGEPFDYFRSRVMFPIGDRAGRVIAFGGRVLTDGQPKYLNSPESPVFQKRRVLYGLSIARASVKPDNPVMVTEGYLDVIALNRAGFSGAVAPLGTALSEEQLFDLWRLSPEPVLCFDGDRAGQSAAARALERALPLLTGERALKFVSLPAGEDPDSILRASGAGELRRILSQTRQSWEMLWECEPSLRDLQTPERRAQAKYLIEKFASKITDNLLQKQYRSFLNDKMWDRIKEVRQGTPVNARQRIGDERVPPPPRAADRVQREILFRILLGSPSLIEEVAEEFAAIEIPEAELDKLRREILEVEALRPGLDASALRQHLLLNGFAATVDALLSPSVDSGFLVRSSDSRTARDEWAHVIGMLMGGHRSALAEASNDLIDDASAANWERFLAARERVLREIWLDDDPI